MRTARRWKVITLIALLVAAAGFTTAPASSHVAGWAHNWTAHIRPYADARYYTKATSDWRYFTKAQSDARYQPKKMKLGATKSGIWSASGPAGGYAVETIDFGTTLPGQVTPHYVTAYTSQCPAVGQAAPGNLCVYSEWTYGTAFHAFLTPSGANARLKGAVLYLSASSDAANARGTWAVTAPTVAGRTVALPRSASPETGR